MEVAFDLDLEVDERMPGEQFEHVVQEADPGCDLAGVPVPSSVTETVTSVSLVRRLTLAERMRLS